MNKISVFIPVLNEEDKIANAIASVTWADEIVVVDTGCTDRTIDIAKQWNCRIEAVKFQGFGHLRNACVNLCKYPWILSIDADECVTEALKNEICDTLKQKDALDLYFIPRRNYFMGQWINHCGWYPDYCQPKLFRKGALIYRDDDIVHEGYDMHGQLGYFKQDVLHFSFRDLSQVIIKMDRYSTLGSEQLNQREIKGSIGKAIAHGIWAFLRIYILKLGFLDGRAGFVIALGNFEGTFYRYAKLAAKQQGWFVPPPSS